MEILLLIFLFTIPVITLIFMFFYIKKQRLLFFKRLIETSIYNQHVYNSLVVEDVCKYLLNIKKRKASEFIKALTDKDKSFFNKQIHDKTIRLKLDVCRGKFAKKELADYVYLLTLAKYYITENSHELALKILQKINVKKLSQKQFAYFRLLMSQIFLFEGDLQATSEDINSILQFFKRKKMYVEEAEAYFVLGTAYRVSGIYDTAEIMLRSALNIYKNIKSAKGEAEVLGTLGLLMSAQNRYDEAKDYYQKALDKSVEFKSLREFILTQQAMLYFLQGKYTKTIKIADNILKQTKNQMVKASIYDILSRIKLYEKKYSSSEKYAKQASEMFFKKKNYASSFECLYLKAIALYEAMKFDESEKTLRFLIEQDKKHKSCFHVASAQTLLGIILLKKDQPERAKAIFNQALLRELCNDRKSGVAVDYVNLAIVEKKQGNMDKAKDYLQKAREQAEQVDDNLVKILNSFFD